MGWINKEDIEPKKIQDLFNPCNIMDGVKFESQKYFIDDDETLWELSYISNDDEIYEKRFSDIKNAQMKFKILDAFDLL